MSALRSPSRRIPAIVLVALAASLWGTDALFRRALALELPAGVVVFYEHLLLALACLPLLLRVPWRRVQWTPRVVGSLLVIGVGASATATFLFTLSFRYGDPTTPLLLQKLQPLIAIAAAAWLLDERPRVRLGGFAAVAILGAYLISLPDPLQASVARLAPALLAVGAAALWGLGTVLGRGLSTTFEAGQLAAIRFTIGLPAAAVVVLVDQGPRGFTVVEASDMPGLIALAAVPGLMALWLYYRGLSGTPASAATLAELAFPLTAIVVNRIAFGTTLTTTQWVGMFLLAGTLVAISRLSQRGYEHVGVEAEAPPTALQR